MTEPHHRKKRTVWLAVLGLGALVTGAAVLLALAPEAKGQRLPDGSTLTLAGSSYGTQHSVVVGGRWQRALYPVTPAPLRPHLACEEKVLQTASPTLVFWVLRRNQPPHDRLHRVTVVDEHGCESSDATPAYSTQVSPTTAASNRTNALDAYTVTAFPRRGERVALRLYENRDGGGWTRIGEFPVGNPLPGAYPVWSPEPLPARKEQDGLSFALVELKTGLVLGERDRAAQPDEEQGTRAAFRVTRGGRPAMEWQPVQVSVADATGNAWNPLCYSPSGQGEEQHVVLDGGLWPDEGAWKLRVEFARSHNFAPAELWTVRGVPIPGRDRNAFRKESVERLGTQIRLARLAGPNAGLPDDTSTTAYATPSAHVAVEPPTEGVRVTLVRAADERGREITVYAPQARSGAFAFGLQTAPGARAVDLTFAVHRSRFVDYLARPSQP